MTNTPLILLLALLLTANLYAEETKKPSPAVKRILDKAVAEVKKNHQDFDKANQTPLDEARTELEDLSTKLIKDGKTDEAKVVLDQMGTLEADVMKMANAPFPVARSKTPPQKPLLQRMAGRWNRGDWIVEIRQDGAYREVKKGTDIVTTTGQLVLNDASTAEVRLTNGWFWQCSMCADDDKLVVFFKNPEGQRQPVGEVLERVK